MKERVFALFVGHRMIAKFIGWQSLVEVLHSMNAYITAEISIEKETGEALAKIPFLDKKISEKFKIPEYPSYVLCRLPIIEEEIICVKKPS